jgi:hypothetical protein
MAPFRELLSKKQKWYWDETLTSIFNESKEKIVNLIREGVRAFEKDRVTCLSTDWSKVGIGFTLMQKYCDCPKQKDTNTWSPTCGEGHWRLVLAGSRFNKPAEGRYAPIEGEALAVVYGLLQCRKFILGSPNLIVAVDHKPLTQIFNNRSLESIANPRLLRMKEKTLLHNFKIVHVPGTSNLAPDAASRYPAQASAAKDIDLDLDLENISRAYAISQAESLPASVTWDEVNREAASDAESVKLREVIENGFPGSRKDLPEELRYFFSMRDDLFVVENVVFKDNKMLIPKKLRPRVVDGLHASHQGVSGMKANAKERLFWPGLDADIKKKRDQCRRCIENAPSQAAEPMILTPPPKLPFQQVAVDFYHKGNHNYLIYADRFSGWTEVARMQSTSFKSIQKDLLSWFRTYGVPEEISSDGGPPFRSADYTKFLSIWVLHSICPPPTTHRVMAAQK